MRIATRLVLLSLVVFAGRAAAAPLVVADGEFDLAGYDVVEVEGGDIMPVPRPDGIGITTVIREPSGGASGAYLKIRTEFYPAPGASGYGSIWAVLLRRGSIDPASHGGFASLRHFEQARLFEGRGDGQVLGPAIRQSDTVYIARVECSPESVWTAKTSAVDELSCVSPIPPTNPVTPDRFVRLQGTGPATPDLSATGAPFQLGFFRAVSGAVSSSGGARTGGIDDWRAVLYPACTGTADCDDGNGCVSDVCDAGVCTGVLLACADDGNPCTTDVCNLATGACNSPPRDCDDGKSCTVDSCTPNGGCQHTVNATYEIAEAKAADFVGTVSGPACSGQPLVKKLRRKVKKKASQIRAAIDRADRATKQKLLDKLLRNADSLVTVARRLLADAVAKGQLSAECAAELGDLLEDVRGCVQGLPRVP